MICPNDCQKKSRRSKKNEKKVDIGRLSDKISRTAGIVVAYGAGVDSTAFVVRMVELRIQIRAIVFADTGSELPRTYQYVLLFSDWLERHGYPRVQIVRNIATRNSSKGAKKGIFESLEDQLLRLGNLPSAAYGAHTCAIKMKIRPSNKWVSDQEWAKDAWSSGKKLLKLIGFESEEGYRAARAFREIGDDSERYELHFPLIEWGWNRAKCEEAIAAAGLPSPGKSACFFCPFRKKEEIESIAAEEPQLFQRALALESRALSSGNITGKSMKGLGGRKFSWKDLLLSGQLAEVA